MEGGIAVRPSLTVETGRASGCRFRLDPSQPVRIGADESCEVCLEGLDLLPIHARLHFGSDGATIQPAEPGAELQLNGSPVELRRLLADGDRIGLAGPTGAIELRFRARRRAVPDTQPISADPSSASEANDG